MNLSLVVICLIGAMIVIGILLHLFVRATP